MKGLVEQNLKFIVFGYHMEMLNALSETLKNLKVDYIRIDGSTRSDLRSTYIDHFQNEKSCQVAVLSLKGMRDDFLYNELQMYIFLFHKIIKFLQLVMQQSH